MFNVLTAVAPTELRVNEPLYVTSHPEVIVCIPAFNECESIGRVVQQSRIFSNQVLVCDDGSKDDTFAEAAKSGARVVQHAANLGKGAALQTLLREALRLNPDVVVTLDGDGQHAPSDIPTMVKPILEGAVDVVVGSRFNGGNHIPLYRRLGNSILSTVTNWSAGTRIEDTQSGFRAYSPRVLESIPIRENGMGVDSYILVQAARGGFRIGEQKVSVSYADNTPTFNPVSHVVRVLWSLARLKFSRGNGSNNWSTIHHDGPRLRFENRSNLVEKKQHN